MGGLDFFCTTMELPDGDTDLLLMSMDAMNADPDPDAEDRKGCSGHVGKMIYSAGVTQLALVAYVPDAAHNKSASKIDVQVWMGHLSPTSPLYLSYISPISPYISLYLSALASLISSQSLTVFLTWHALG